MVLNGQTNTELVTLLNRTGTQAIGISGLDASFLKSTLEKLADARSGDLDQQRPARDVSSAQLRASDFAGRLSR
jgi:acetylglutamate kinase